MICGAHFVFVQISKPWLPNLDKTLQPRYVIDLKKLITLLSYVAIINVILPNWLKKKKQQTQTRWILKVSLSCIALLWQHQTRLNTIPWEHFKLATVTRLDVILFNGKLMHIPCRKYTFHAFNPPVIIPEGELVCPYKFMTPMRKTSYWYHDPD